MNATDLLKSSGTLIALALCSACGGGMPVTTAYPSLNALTRYPTIVPGGSTKSKAFVYVMNADGTNIFDYPKSDRQIGLIANVGGGGCTNVLYGYGEKIFWIVAGPDAITEYQVLKKPIETLSVSVGQPSGCAMDTSGDLAVGILFGSGGGDIVIFKNASGSGTVMTTPLSEAYFVGYGNDANLFADGFSSAGNFALVKLPKGSKKFETIATSNTVKFPGSVQYDGKYLTVADQAVASIYQYTVSGTKATLKGTVSLSGAGDCAQTWIGRGVVFCADAGTGAAEAFKYPAGGSPVATLTGSFDQPLGVVAAEK
jgi:hypothetical protein